MGRLETVWSPELSAADGEAYDGFVAAARGGHFCQTRSWAKVAMAAGTFAPSFFLARRDKDVVGAAVVLQTRLRGILTLPFVQIERGPVCDDPEQLPDVLEALHAQTRRRGILRLSVMPYWTGEAKAQVERTLKQHGFTERQSFGGRHVRTLRLDLTRLPTDELFAGRALFKVRQNIGRAERAGATARPGRNSDLGAFRRMHEELLRFEGRPPLAASWYDALAEHFLACEERGAMFVGEYEGNAVSAVFVARHGVLATYIIGASSGRALRFPKMILPLAAAIAWAKRSGLESFDLGGIPAAGDTDAKRASIAEFKHSFSRDEIDLVREHVRWF